MCVSLSFKHNTTDDALLPLVNYANLCVPYIKVWAGVLSAEEASFDKNIA